MGIYEKLNIIRSAKADICQAILGKNPSVSPTDDIRQWPMAITSISGGSSPSASPNDVVFRDCDGKILYSYSRTEIASLSELPALPTKSGLTCQGWNWTLQQIKDYAAAYGKCEIGATYTTDDGKTRIKLTIQDPKYTTIPIVFQQTVANGVKVNWGDGSIDQTYSETSQQTISHTYAPSAYPATYTITFEVTSGMMSFPENIMGQSGSQSISNPKDAWVNMIDEVNIGDNVTSIGDSAFSGCHRLTSVTIPNSIMNIGQSAFSYCSSLVSITIPSSVISIQIYQFQYCYSLTSIMIPSSVTSIGNTVFRGCNSLASITIPSSVTNIGSNVFYECYCLTQITIPSSVNSIGNVAFRGCTALVSIVIPDAITTIGQNMFYICYSLASITMPSSVTSIGTLAFYACFGLKTFDFRRSTSVPTLANVNAFINTPSTKEIIVPDELYDTWIAATNWNSTTNNISTSIIKASESSLGTL